LVCPRHASPGPGAGRSRDDALKGHNGFDRRSEAVGILGLTAARLRGGVYNLGTPLSDAATVMRHNRASTSDDEL
jgi:hypothetical protein